MLDNTPALSQPTALAQSLAPHRLLSLPTPQGRYFTAVSLYIAIVLSLFTANNALSLEGDKKQPIKISANSAERDEKRAITRYQGDVYMSQGSLKITAEEVVIANKGNAVTSITATGEPARFQQQPKKGEDPVIASANTVIYHIQKSQIQLDGSARIVQAGRSVSGDVIDYYIEQQRFSARSRNSGKKGTNGRPKSRVEVIIPVE